ncbi:Uncharacterised protein [Vibrio cholerae]|nr:Uncharacterised protein [Vibrio cholerae]
MHRARILSSKTDLVKEKGKKLGFFSLSTESIMNSALGYVMLLSNTR